MVWHSNIAIYDNEKQDLKALRKDITVSVAMA
jgi:hypothetical protein